MKRGLPLFGLGLACALLSSCGIEDATKQTLAQVQQSNLTQSAILLAAHRQTLNTAYTNMLSPDNTLFLNPPTQMMPFAQTFADEATADELVQVEYVLLNTVQLPAQGTETAAQTQDRMVSFAAFTTLAGLTQKPKFDALLSQQVEQGGRYYDTVSSMAAARYSFILNVLFTPLVERSTTLTVGSLQEAVTRFNAMRALVYLPYASQMTLVNPNTKGKIAIDPVSAFRNLGLNAIDDFQSGLDAKTFAANQALLNQFIVP